MKHSKGFTLIELMVVIAIVGILAAIAIPAYSEQARKSRRGEAVSAIGEIQLRQERWRADQATYGNTTAASAAAGNLFGSVANVTAYNSTLTGYDISITGNSGTAYTITATRKGDMASDPKCGNFTLSYSAGTSTKGVSSGDVDYCWAQ